MAVLDEIEAAIPPLRRYARALVRDADAADDLVQDCLERAIRRHRFWRGGGPIETWLFRILLNRFRDERRRYGRALRVVGAENTADVARPGGQEAHMALEEVHEAMGRLPDEQRAALLLVALEGMTIAEAATVLAIKTDTLASRLARARAALRSMTGRPGATGGPERRKPSLTDRGNIDAEAIARLRHGGPDGARELARLADDPAVRETLEEWDRQDAALQTLYGPVTEEPVPERLRMVIDGATPQKRFSASLSRLAAVLALLAIGGVAGWGTARVFAPGGEAPDLPEFALRAYETYAPEIVHPVEVSAAQHDHLTAWLSKRVGLKLSLPDLQAEGFRLMGGRIVPDEHGVAALLMYEDAGGKRMTLYVAAEPDAKETGFRYASNGGVDSVWWYGEGLGCAIVADLPRDRLKALGVAAYEQIVAL